MALDHVDTMMKMNITKDTSYGVVPVYKDPTGKWKVLVVHQLSHRGTLHRFWIFPKGHAEGDETPAEAALRELAEETGLTEVQLETAQEFSIAYSFQHEGVRIDKTVTYFIGYCDAIETELTQPEEILDMKWTSFEKAYQQLTHANSKDVLKRVETFLSREN